METSRDLRNFLNSNLAEKHIEKRKLAEVVGSPNPLDLRPLAGFRLVGTVLLELEP